MYTEYDSQLEELCDVCGGCDRVGTCPQEQEVQACNREITLIRKVYNGIIPL